MGQLIDTRASETGRKSGSCFLSGKLASPPLGHGGPGPLRGHPPKPRVVLTAVSLYRCGNRPGEGHSLA